MQLVKEKGSLFSKQKHCQTITRWQQNWLMPKPHPVVEPNRIRSSSVSWRLGCWTMTFTIWIASTQRLRIEILHPSKFKAQFVTKTNCQQLLRMLSLHFSHRWFFGGYFFFFFKGWWHLVALNDQVQIKNNLKLLFCNQYSVKLTFNYLMFRVDHFF